MTDLFKNVSWCIMQGIGTALLLMLKSIPDHLKTQEMCNDIMRINLAERFFLPDCFKTQEMCNEALTRNPYTLRFVPDHFKGHGM